jgi:hypothetical protein
MQKRGNGEIEIEAKKRERGELKSKQKSRNPMVGWWPQELARRESYVEEKTLENEVLMWRRRSVEPYVKEKTHHSHLWKRRPLLVMLPCTVLRNWITVL